MMHATETAGLGSLGNRRVRWAADA